jgi:hypothetical protein
VDTFFYFVFKLKPDYVIIFTGEAMTETITYTLETGAQLTIYRTATFGDLAIVSVLTVLILFLLFAGIFNLTSKRRAL